MCWVASSATACRYIANRSVAETREPDARISGVAARYGTWRRQAREGVLVAPEMPVFVPVEMFKTPQPAAPGRSSSSPPPARSSSALIEIKLGNRRQVRVGSDVNLAVLRRVLTALRG